ncbi:Cyclin-B2-3 [Gracilariopsis chorda]|uniref:Cyclin-B2-3 n=1 Tax=Gracilariopsis chorda TaxID=448386 RepID=A0A2V3IVI2_9FLOR|nr:Cyclin-B2-3 [Gracilariopsis chorda]|eukprot:PXF46099.1 Cyclin-B2-3 [Gracilariopsis chorda]
MSTVRFPPRGDKRALGDITNLHQNDPIPLKPNQNVAKPRRAPIAKSNANALAARRAANASVLSDNTNSHSPMSTGASAPRLRLSARNSRSSKNAAHAIARAAAAAAAVSCKLHFPSERARHLPSSRPLLKPPFPVIDLDAEQRHNHLAAAEYACQIHANMVNVETKFMPDPGYMTRQADITVRMRAILVDWLVDVHQKFNLKPETLHLTVNIIDRFLEVTQVVRRKLQLVGVTAMFIASKYEEIFAPMVADFVYISDKAYTKDEILSMEAFILNALNFDVTVPSSLSLMRRCLKAATATSGTDLAAHRHLTHYLMELALQDSVMLEFRPSVRVASACRLAARLCRISLPWDRSMKFHSGGWTERDIAECEGEMIRLLQQERDGTGNSNLTAVKRKFSSERFSAISANVPSTDSIMDCSEQ